MRYFRRTLSWVPLALALTSGAPGAFSADRPPIEPPAGGPGPYWGCWSGYPCVATWVNPRMAHETVPIPIPRPVTAPVEERPVAIPEPVDGPHRRHGRYRRWRR